MKRNFLYLFVAALTLIMGVSASIRQAVCVVWRNLQASSIRVEVENV
jgi:hypothetical protein